MVKSIRDTLDESEKQLQAEIDALRKQLAPLERELADVRVAKAALAPQTTLAKGRTLPPDAHTAATVESAERPSQLAYESPYRKLTMKQLVQKALREHFQNGATARQLIEFFADAWGRTDVSRTSLSPQLSRLKRSGVVERKDNVWHLVKDAPNSETPDVVASGVSDDEGGASSSTEEWKMRDLLS